MHPTARPVTATTALDAVEVVVKGSFNPAIFSPAWLLGEDLIGVAEYDNVEISLISRDFASFTAGWLRCDVTPEGCQFATQEPEEFERLRDVTVGVLRALPKTPIAALGLNRVSPALVPSLEAWHAIGDRLAPKELWSDLLVAPGMRAVTVWGVRPDGFTGRVQVHVEPSFRVPRAVFISVNDHFNLTLAIGDPNVADSRDQAWQIGSEPEVEETPGKIEVAVEVLIEHWSASMTRAEDYIHKVLAEGLGR